jgi:MoxR-like ATPase
MIIAAQALALVRGRDYVLPEDVRGLAPDVLRHRLVLSYEALSDGVEAQQIVDAVLGRVPLPDVVLRDPGR